MNGPPRSPVESALDVFVYAPIGLAFDGPAGLTTLVQRGRSQVAMARTIGQFAVQQGQSEAGKAIAKLTEQAGGLLGGPSPERAAASPTTTVPDAPAPSTPASTPAPATPTATAAPEPPAPSGPQASDLAIPDYDSLSASQVVSRLAGLSSTELEAVTAYETAGRGRKTVLNKVAQLQRS